MTSPFSIYILIGVTYFDYKAEPFAAYIDSGFGLCLAKSDCFPPKYHETLLDIQGKDISNQDIILRKGIKTLNILIDRYVIKLPYIYFHTTGCDILLGNNFLQLFKNVTPQNRGVSLTTCQPAEYSWMSGNPTPLTKIGQSLLCTGSFT